jgi:general secretion pathway protein J
MARAKAPRGFTLVEVLVAIVLLALLTGLAWRGIDGLLRARTIGADSVARSSRLQTALAQWERDLSELQDSQVVPALDFDGRALRFTRRSEDGLQVVVWWVDEGRWWRWASAPVRTQPPLLAAYRRSQQTSTLAPQALAVLDGVGTWQLAYFRLNAWTNAMSSADLDVSNATAPKGNPGTPGSPAPNAPPTPPTPPNAPNSPNAPTTGEPRATLPSGIRVRLVFEAGSGVGGPLVHQLLVPGGT